MQSIEQQPMPDALKQFIQAEVDTLNRGVTVDGKRMTVIELAKAYRSLKATAVILGVTALIAALGFAYLAVYPIESVRFVVPATITK